MAWSSLKVAGSDPFPCSHNSATLYDGQVFIFGGKDGNSGKLLNNLTVLNTSGLKSWVQPKQTGIAPTPRF